MEANYVVACDAKKGVVWMRKFLTELEVVPSIAFLISLYCDNNGAIAQGMEPKSHQKSKHIELIQEIVAHGDV